jgi:CBS domain-containing protein
LSLKLPPPVVRRSSHALCSSTIGAITDFASARALKNGRRREETLQAMNASDHAHVVEAMHRGVITCRPESSALAVARTMAAHRIHCVVVNAAPELPRVVTVLEIAGALYDERLESCTAADLSKPSPVLRPDDTVAFALERMHEDAAGHAVVVDPLFRLLGVVSVLDIVEWALRGVAPARP